MTSIPQHIVREIRSMNPLHYAMLNVRVRAGWGSRHQGLMLEMPSELIMSTCRSTYRCSTRPSYKWGELRQWTWRFVGRLSVLRSISRSRSCLEIEVFNRFDDFLSRYACGTGFLRAIQCTSRWTLLGQQPFVPVLFVFHVASRPPKVGSTGRSQDVAVC